MVFFTKSGKEKSAQARSLQAPRTRPPAYPKERFNDNARASDISTTVTVSTKRRIVVTPLVPSVEGTINSNTTKGEVAARHHPDNEKLNAPVPLRLSFGSSNEANGDIDSVFGDLSLSNTAVSVGRAILPSSKDVPRQTREPTSTRHGEDPSSSSRGQDNDWPSQTVQVHEGVKEQINFVSLQPQVKKFDPLSSKPQKSFDQPELQEKKSKKAVFFRKTVLLENNSNSDRRGSVGKDPPARTAASAANKRSSIKPERMPNKIVQEWKSNSQDDDDRHSLGSRPNASSQAAYPNIDQTESRDDNFDSVVDRNANKPNSQEEEFSVNYSTCDEDESVASTSAKTAYQQDDVSNFGELPCFSCPIFQRNDDEDNGTFYIIASETVATESVYHDGYKESADSDCSSSSSEKNSASCAGSSDDTRTFLSEKSYLVDDGSSNGNYSAPCSSTSDETRTFLSDAGSDDTRTFLSDADAGVGRKKVDEGTGWWFGCGQRGNEVKEEHECTSMSPSNDGTVHTGQSDGTGHNGQSKETMTDEKSLKHGNEIKEEHEGPSMTPSDDGTGYTEQSDHGTGHNGQSKDDEKSLVNNESNKTTIFRNHSSTTTELEDVTTASVNGRSSAPDPPQQPKHDREGRLLLSSIPLNPVPSLTKSFKKLKGRVNSGDKGGDKTISIASCGTPSISMISSDKSMPMTPSDKSLRSTKPLINSPKNHKLMNEKVQGTVKLSVDKRLWDSDDRQRDLYCAERGGVSNLIVRQYSSIPVPNAPDHVLVKVEASTVSSRDCSVRASGDPNTAHKPLAHKPFIPGFQAVGQVCAVGAKVDPLRIRLGDRVAALLPNGGGNAKYISIPVSWAMILPESANHDDIICLVANYMTAYQCLKLAKKDGAPLTNANVLITGGSGPVGQALIELALQEGANVYTTAHKMHEEHLTKLGTKWFSVKPDKWLPVLEGKMDVVVDNLKIDGYVSSYRALTDNGILICNFGPDMGNWWSSLKAMLWSRAIFYDLHESYKTNPRLFAHEFHYLTNKLQRGEIWPKVAGRVTLNQVPKAQQLLEKGLPNGTVICLPWKKLDPKQKVKVEKWQYDSV